MENQSKLPKPVGRPRLIKPLIEKNQNIPTGDPEPKTQSVDKITTRSLARKPKENSEPTAKLSPVRPLFKKPISRCYSHLKPSTKAGTSGTNTRARSSSVRCRTSSARCRTSSTRSGSSTSSNTSGGPSKMKTSTSVVRTSARISRTSSSGTKAGLSSSSLNSGRSSSSGRSEASNSPISIGSSSSSENAEPSDTKVEQSASDTKAVPSTSSRTAGPSTSNTETTAKKRTLSRDTLSSTSSASDTKLSSLLKPRPSSMKINPARKGRPPNLASKTGAPARKGRPPKSKTSDTKAGSSTADAKEGSSTTVPSTSAGPPPSATTEAKPSTSGVKPSTSRGKRGGPKPPIYYEAQTISTFLSKVRSPQSQSPSETLTKAREAAVDLLKNLITKTSELEELKEEHTKLKNKHKVLEWDHLKLTDTNIDLSTYNTNLNLVNTDLTEQLDTLSSEVRAFEIKFKKIELKENECTKEISRLKNIEKEYEELKKNYDAIKDNSREVEFQELKKDYEDIKMNYAAVADKNLQLTVDYDNLHAKAVTLDQEVIECHLLRRTMHNTIQELRGNMRVFCRIRPPNSKEQAKPRFYLHFPSERRLEIQRTKDTVPIDSKIEFTFDKVFRPDHTQSQCFDELIQFVQSAMDGFDVCVLTYGQTGSGKTYTLQGLDNPDQLGMIHRAVSYIFNQIEYLSRFSWSYEVKVSFLEIHNEYVRDLLNPNTHQNCLEVRYTEETGLTVSNLNVRAVDSYETFYSLLMQAQQNRMQYSANFSEHNARSHAVYKIDLFGSNETCSGSYSGSINLVDLAGSEASRGSLSVLATVLSGIYNNEKNVPFRNSMLTYLLQSCLGGHSKTLLFVTLAPFEDCYMETLNSLRFAVKVKEVKRLIRRFRTLPIPYPSPQASTSNSGIKR